MNRERLTYNQQLELKAQGTELCPYVRNPTETRGLCALSIQWNKCKTPFNPNYKECRCYKEYFNER